MKCYNCKTKNVTSDGLCKECSGNMREMKFFREKKSTGFYKCPDCGGFFSTDKNQSCKSCTDAWNKHYWKNLAYNTNSMSKS